MLIPLLLAAAFLVVAMTFAWYVQRRTGNSGWIDATWSFAVGLAGISLALSAGFGARQLLVAALVAIWSLRLGGYIAFRSAGAPEDPRYAALMEEWGEGASRRLFQFLQVQALAGLILAYSIYVAALDPEPGLRALDWAAPPCSHSPCWARRSLTSNCAGSGRTAPIAARSVIAASGAGRAIPITSLNGSVGSRFRSSRSAAVI